MDRRGDRHSGGRPEPLTPRQHKRLGELSEAGPLGVGFETACWNAVLSRGLSWRAFGVLCQRPSVCPLLHNRGVAFHTARLVSEHLDAAKRLAGRQDKGPALVRAAKRCKGRRRCAEEARVAQGGA